MDATLQRLRFLTDAWEAGLQYRLGSYLALADFAAELTASQSTHTFSHSDMLKLTQMLKYEGSI